MTFDAFELIFKFVSLYNAVVFIVYHPFSGPMMSWIHTLKRVVRPSNHTRVQSWRGGGMNWYLKRGLFFPASGVIRYGKLNRWYLILPYVVKSSFLRSPTFFYFISKIAYVVKKLRSALAGSIFNRLLRYSKSRHLSTLPIFCILWNFLKSKLFIS